MNEKNFELEKLFTSAVENQQRNNFEIAENLYNEILIKIPNHINTRCNLAAIYIQTNKKKSAMEQLQTVLKIEPDNIIATSNLGLLYMEHNEFPKAIECYQKALHLDSKNADAYNNIGINYKHLGEADLATANFKKAIEINPKHVKAYNNLGILLSSLEKYDESITSFKKALEIQPKFLKAQTNISNTYMRQQKYFDKAITESNKALNMFVGELGVYKEFVLLFRLKHDVEQASYLKSKNYKVNGLDDFKRIGEEILNREENKENKNNFSKKILLKDNEKKYLLPFCNTQLLYKFPKLPADTLNPDKDWISVENEYLSSDKQIIYIDDFLSQEAINQLREFSLVSKIWIHEKPNKYLGAFSDSGFISPLHIQIGTELQKKLPRLFGKYNIGKFWGFKYDTTLGGGIGIHADFANLNLNFWITPDKYNKDKNKGGLKVYDVPPPEHWVFDKYNSDAEAIYKFLKEKNANCKTVPYKFNRAVLFNSAYFHETDKIDFKEGYESRRINVTYLFGSRKL